ncbi:MAG: hypothetical protein P1S60_05610 [Anaerolineae bacterium]|nr:hypothetical protein [Anaerolineae bacterium]
MVPTGTIQQTIELLKTSLTGLHVDINPVILEDLAVLIHEAMTVNARSFHTIEHVFTLSDGSNPIQALAALFHDIVYFEVDQGFTTRIYYVLSTHITQSNGDIVLKKTFDTDDTAYRVTLDMFGFKPGQKLSRVKGLNEFLSALLMIKLLEFIVPLVYLVKILACIEATIPFRGINKFGQTPAEVIERRLSHINQTYNLGLLATEIEAATMNAVIFSNRDVMNFAESDTGRFLDNTWKLLPELNPNLRLQGYYSIKSYRKGLEKMESFMLQLNPGSIFNRYAGEPSPTDYERMLEFANRNIATARQYLGIELLSATILEALAEITGGDVPVALFIGGIDGELPDGQKKWEDFLPDVPATSNIRQNSTIFDLLAFGRTSSSSFDLQHSPLSLFLFKSLELENTNTLLTVARKYYSGQMEAHTFLNAVPASIMHAISSACAEMAITRQAELLAYADSRIRMIESAQTT